MFCCFLSYCARKKFPQTSLFRHEASANQPIQVKKHHGRSLPTHVREILIDMPHYVGYHDAAAEGAGGIWFPLGHTMPPVAWRLAFLPDIAQDVVSLSNPDGSITNSDLELAVEVLAVGVLLAKASIIKHQPIGTLCDNSPTISWVDKMASKSRSPTAGRFLRGLAYMLYCHRAGWLTTVHVPGKDNAMADIASCPSKAHALFRAEQPVLSHQEFVSASFPLPQQQAWQLAMVPLRLKSNHCVGSNWHCDSGRCCARALLACMGGALQTLPTQ